MSDQLNNMGAKSRKSKYIKWLNEENKSKPSPPTESYKRLYSEIMYGIASDLNHSVTSFP